jgi:hypothetical protein
MVTFDGAISTSDCTHTALNNTAISDNKDCKEFGRGLI